VLEKVNELPDPLAKEDKIAIRKTFDLIRLILRGIEDEIF
jgi:hypothetical protein